MSVRQYIGARYVPRFSDVNGGVWSDVYSYDPLIIVKNGNDYYTSKKSVPIGIAITNTEYWIKTGDYNGAISSLQEQINSINTDISDIESTISKYHDRKLLVIGDSYADSNRGNYAHGYVTVIQESLNIDDSDVYIYQQGGAGFCGNSMGKSFITLINDAIAALTAAERAAITDVLIAGGTNDVTYSISDINTAKTNAINLILANFSNARIHIAMIGGFKHDPASYTALIQNVKYVYDYSGGSINTITDAYKAMMLLDSYDTNYSDSVHPSRLGCQRIGMLLAEGIRSLTSSGHRMRLTSDDIINVSGLDGQFSMRFVDMGNCIGLTLRSSKSISGLSLHPAYNQPLTYKIGGVSAYKSFIQNTPNATGEGATIPFTVPIMIRVYAGESDIKEYSGELRIVTNENNGYDLWLYSSHVVPTSGTITMITIRPFSTPIMV